MPLPNALFCVDAFAGRAGTGNPAGVCLLDRARDPVWMQLVAREMNLSETAFLVQDRDGYVIRWFTPRVEIELAGHPTIAAAHILWEEGYLKGTEPARFISPSGPVSAENLRGIIELDFPPVPARPAEAPPALAGALGIHPSFTGMSRFDYLLEAADEQEVRDMTPDFQRLAAVPMRGVIVTARASTPGFDFVSRFFAPSVGVNEDPVTGSAHCTLAPYWQERLGKDSFIAFQASERGGTLHLRVRKDGRIGIAGEATTVWKGALLI